MGKPLAPTGAWEVESYRPAHQVDLLGLWNRSFGDRRNYRWLSPELWQERVELAHGGDAFNPDFLQVALEGDRVVGFCHGGLWSGDFIEQVFGHERPAEGAGYLALIVVDSDYRRQGVGRSLLAALTKVLRRESSLDTLAVLADGRGYNPFYGNFLAPIPPLWGTTEGIAVPQADLGTRSAMGALGFDQDAIGVTMTWRGSEAESRGSRGDNLGNERSVDIVMHPDYQPFLGTSDGSKFPLENKSVTWVAIQDTIQVGTLIAYPLETDKSSDAGPLGGEQRWAIYSLEVESASRGRGVGRALLEHAKGYLQERGVAEMETFVIPDESPGAVHIYRAAGFEKKESWVIYS